MFAEQQTHRIDWGGSLYSLYDLPTDLEQFTVRINSAGRRSVQGLHLRIKGGELQVGGRTSTDILLWADTAPSQVAVLVKWSASKRRSLRVWNTWRVNGVAQAWLGNAGMRVTQGSDGVISLMCSDGEGDPDFTNLVVTIDGVGGRAG